MTRDEAIEIFGGPGGFPMLPGPTCAQWVDVFVALGMLKLDPPPQTLWAILRRHDIPIDKAQWICNEASNAGFLRSPQASEEAHD